MLCVIGAIVSVCTWVWYISGVVDFALDHERRLKYEQSITPELKVVSYDTVVAAKLVSVVMLAALAVVGLTWACR